ncbi:MAG: tripartite tricarboxylate transporter TctB family protein [Candidatus Tectomicrobia bacterium]|uniref:Tripartite tricarboxylate transporter TctB family protein n=1 Tax=Tectimicrobiota bacterium TaxID=2528274 RepID=A0A932GM86_UNCTE|nr:tripartite tricarboxylate transporter TctB family protein [Candidatus Tectomicrobia bacterium]
MGGIVTGLLNLGSLVSLVILIFSLTFLIETFRYGPVPALFPRLVSGLVILATACLLVGRIRSVVKAGKTETAEAGAETGGARRGGSIAGIAWWSYAAMVGYFLLIPLLGLLWPTLAYTLLIPFMLHYGRWKVVIPVAVGITAALYYPFTYLLRIPMPQVIF